MDLVSVLIQHGAVSSINDIIVALSIEIQNEHIQLLLQRLSLPYTLGHVEIKMADDDTFRSSHTYDHKITFGLPKYMNLFERVRITNIICHILKKMCFLTAQSYTYPDDIHTPDWEILSHSAPSLQQMCVVTIRQHLPVKTVENFATLGLPPMLMSSVSLHGLAEEITQMWKSGKEDSESE